MRHMMSFFKMKSALVIVLSMVVIGLCVPVSAQSSFKQTIDTLVAELYGKGNISAVDSVFAPSFVRHPGETDLTAFKISVLSLRAAMPDLMVSTEVSLEEGNLVATRLRMKGTFTGEFVTPNALPIAPNNQPIEFVVNVVYRFDEAGLITEEWDAFDNLAFLGQLGVLPASNTPIPAPMLYPDVVDIGMSAQNRTAVEQYVAAINQGNLDFMNQAFKDDLSAHNPFGVLDRTGLAGDLGRLQGALPNLTLTVEQIVTEGNWTAIYYTLNGTFSGNFVNADGSAIPPTGLTLNLPTITLFRFDQQGLIAEAFEMYDSLSFLTQLGLITVTAPILTPSP